MSITDRLRALLDEVDDVPALINQLSHDILRKLILYVGISTTVKIHGHTCKVSELMDGLKRDEHICVIPCSVCERVDVYTSFRYIIHCPGSSRDCDNFLCSEHRNEICPDCFEGPD